LSLPLDRLEILGLFCGDSDEGWQEDVEGHGVAAQPDHQDTRTQFMLIPSMYELAEPTLPQRVGH
jgi:hypothetical protein